MNRLPDAIFKEWRHSHEESTENNVRIYRPSNYNFPLSRGRTGLEFKPNGEAVIYDIGARNGDEKILGYWEFTEPNELIVSSNDKTKSYRFHILELNEKILKVRKT
jgi:hypothetical protein